MSPKVSIVVAVRDGESTLGSALASLQVQTLDDIEVLVVDDGSSDGTFGLLKQLASQDNRIWPIRLERNVGVYGARAVGLEVASAPWIGFLDADDLALPTMFERLLGAAQESQADIALCGSLLLTPGGQSLGPKVKFQRGQVFDNDLFERFCRRGFGSSVMWNKLYRAELIKSCHALPQRIESSTEDTLVNIGCFWEAHRVVTLPELLHRYVRQSGSLTKDLQPEEGFVKIVRAFAVAVDLYAHLGPQAQAGIADLYRAQLAYPSYALPWQASLPTWSGAPLSR